MTVPASPVAVSVNDVLFYVATTDDYQLALGAAAVAGISSNNIIATFETAWDVIAGGAYLVFAVGDYANNALRYNPCGWANPDDDPAGTTPFTPATSPIDSLPGANKYVNAAGAASLDTIAIAGALAYYAVNGEFLEGYSSYPTPSTPSDSCEGGSASVACPCTPPATRAGIVALGASYNGQQYNGGVEFVNPFGPSEEWCALFLTFLWQANGIDIPQEAFTGKIYTWAESLGQTRPPTATPELGDAVLFGTGPENRYTSVHASIVVDVTVSEGVITLTTVNGDDGANGVNYATFNPATVTSPGPVYAYASPLPLSD